MPPLVKVSKKLQDAYKKAVEEGYEKDFDSFKKETALPRNSNVEAGYLCTIVNDMDLISEEYIRQTLNYQYYIDEVYKVINLINNGIKEEQLSD